MAIEQEGGYKVCGYDPDPRVEETLLTRQLPYKEHLAQDYLDETNITLYDSIKLVVQNSDIIFVPIQTPHLPLYEGDVRIPESRVDFDYSFLKTGIEEISKCILEEKKEKVVIIISTVLPGTVERELKPLLNQYVKLCYNPFFIAMGTCIPDFLNSEFILFGVDDSVAAGIAENFYKTITKSPFYKTTVKNAELVKVAYNTFIGMKIVFANVLMEICHKTGADVDAVTNALKLANRRIISGNYFSGGMGDGGGCHPRDNIALSWLAKKLNLSYDWFEGVMVARENQTEWLATLMEQYDLPKVILGKAFKPETNLTLGSPSVLLKNILVEKGYTVTIFDPFVDGVVPKFEKSVFLVGTKHECFKDYEFPVGSVVIDPWRYIPDKAGITIIRVGEGKDGN
jgi:UDPglucose 6-dehydrogenase